MLTKPISLYPDAVSISPVDNKISLSATYSTNCSFETFMGEDGIEYCYASLLMADDMYDYRVYVGYGEDNADGYQPYVEKSHFYPKIYKESDSIKLVFDLDLSRTDLYGRAIGIKDAKDINCPEDSMFYKIYVPISDLVNNKIYRWKVRAFEKNSILNSDKYISKTEIGYGVISAVDKPEDAVGSLLTIFPHTNIYDWVLGDVPQECTDYDPPSFESVGIYSNDEWYFGTNEYKDLGSYYYGSSSIPISRSQYNSLVSSDNIYKARTIMNIVRHIDTDIKYYIKLNGTQYKISKYRIRPMEYRDYLLACRRVDDGSIVYYDAGWKDECQTNLGYLAKPLNGHSRGVSKAVEYCIDEALSYTDGMDSYGNPISGYALIDSEDTFQENSTYKLCCNFIDSDEAYFEMHSKPIVTLTETNGQIELTDAGGNIILGTEVKPYTLTYCNINILGEIYQAEGIECSYYNYKVYEKNSIGDYERIYHSPNIYSSDLRIVYEDFLNKREYKIVLTIVDTKNTTIERELYFITSFSAVLNPIMARAEYYKDHNSVIIEWSAINSITPIVKNKNFKFVDLSGDGENDAVLIEDGNTATYYQNDFNQPLSFSKPLFGIRFKSIKNIKKVAEVHSPDNIYIVSVDSLYNVAENDCSDVIIIDTATTRHIYSIKNMASTDEAISALSSGTSPVNKTIVWDNNLTWDGSYIWVNGQDTNESEYEVIISSDDNCSVRCITTGETLNKIGELRRSTPIIKESKVILYDNVYFTNMTLLNNSDAYNIDDFINSEWRWVDNTQLLASFNGSFNGADAITIGNSKLIGYKVYKSIGDSVKLYKIAETAPNETIIEDFIVGDNCEYKYYIYPLFQDQLNENLYYPNNAIETNEIMLHYATNKVVSLKNMGGEIYCADLDGIWRIMLNLEDNGYTIKNAKTFADSLNTYTQEYVGNMKYITKSVSGLIGMIDCYTDCEIIDTYDMLISWNDFVTSANLKCYIDSRGLILPGNFETDPNIEYSKCSKSYATAKFNWRQKSDLDIIKIYATIIPYNPIHEGSLYSDDSLHLISVDNKLLLANGR